MTDFAVLFARHPEKHTDEDIRAIIEKMREIRHTFNTVGPSARKPAGEKKKKLNLSADIADLDLGDLDL